mmetsp:Transcript_29578/g.61847  ORF Transcript_29578/g.61847 Transcript_29578/m.61847 type:complete len:236 (+) Transcript_29578:2087-2794(+)
MSTFHFHIITRQTQFKLHIGQELVSLFLKSAVNAFCKVFAFLQVGPGTFKVSVQQQFVSGPQGSCSSSSQSASSTQNTLLRDSHIIDDGLFGRNFFLEKGQEFTVQKVELHGIQLPRGRVLQSNLKRGLFARQSGAMNPLRTGQIVHHHFGHVRFMLVNLRSQFRGGQGFQMFIKNLGHKGFTKDPFVRTISFVPTKKGSSRFLGGDFQFVFCNIVYQSCIIQNHILGKDINIFF